MRIAILTVTAPGFATAKKISDSVGGKIFCKGRDFDNMKNFVAEIFSKFDALIFVCAAGIAVRMIAPHIVSKLSDPAVIVSDERGKNIISLLSGHVGGANFLTEKISQPVERIKLFATIDVKRDEEGLLNFAEEVGREIKFFDADELAKKISEYKLDESDFVKKIIGVGNVCEASALCCVEKGKFALMKNNFEKKVTVALIWEK